MNGQPFVIMDSVDISPEIIGEIRIVRRERAAATATFEWRTSTTPVLPTDLIRTAVTVYWVVPPSDSTVLYTGFVNDASWDLKSRTYSISCSDFFQELFEGKTDAEIQALIPQGTYSENVFGPRKDGWQYAQALMSTAPYDYFLDNNGVLRSSPWQRSGGVGLIFGANQVLNGGAYVLEMSKGRDIDTQFKLSYKYRFNRWKRRSHGFGWTELDQTGGWCDWVQNLGYDIPTKEAITAAAQGTGWRIGTPGLAGSEPSNGGISFTNHPPTGTYCGGQINWVITDESRQALALAARWTGYRKWAQTVVETYDVTFNALGAQAHYGVHPAERSASYGVESDDSVWEAQDSVKVMPGVWSVDSLDDVFQDQDDEAAREKDAGCLWDLAYTTLYVGFRKNFVSISTSLQLEIALNQDAEVDTPDILARGKVAEIEHAISSASHTTRVKLAITHGGFSSTSDPKVIFPRPSSAPTHTAPDDTTFIPSRVGGCNDSVPYDQTWENGWMCNQKPLTCSNPATPPNDDQIYPLSFVVTGPDIEDEARDDVDATQTLVYRFSYRDDILVLR